MIAVPPPAIPVISNTVTSSSNNRNQQNPVTHPLHLPNTRYAQTRYPFPPLCIRFNSGKPVPSLIKEGLIEHCKKEHQLVLNILNSRLITNNSGNHDDILLYLKDAFPFSFLLNYNNWPKSFNDVPYLIPSLPSIPPQLSLIVKNVDLRIDFNEFALDVKARYPQVKNGIRLKNKLQNDIKLVKVEFTSPTIREKLLNDRKITVGYIVYVIDEYLAPADVLICSQCMGIGHFKKQCTQSKVTCSTCGESVEDIKAHKCSKIEKYTHCGQNYKSNSLKCQVVKSFRAELTRKLLSPNNPTTSSTSNNGLNMNNSSLIYNTSNFPVIPFSQSPANNIMVNKLNDVLEKLSEVNTHLSNLQSKYDRFEQFMLDKNEHDLLVNEKLNCLSKQSSELKNDMTHNGRLLQQYNDKFMKLLFPILDDLVGFIALQNQDKKGNPLDADLKIKLERYRIQMKKAKERKQFTI